MELESRNIEDEDGINARITTVRGLNGFDDVCNSA